MAILKGRLKKDIVKKKSEISSITISPLLPIKEFKPTLQEMKRIGKRIERKGFPLELEKQSKEYLARFNWKAGISVRGITYQGTVNLVNLGEKRVPHLNVAGDMFSDFGIAFDKTFVEKGKKCFENKKKKFGDKFKRISLDTRRKDKISFRAFYPIKEGKLTNIEIDWISDFIHDSFGCFRINI
jgi:hypothetical protein